MALSDNVLDFINRKNALMYAFCDNWARELENQAKLNKQWKDRSSHAVQGLRGDVSTKNNQFTISLSHGVEYGTFLETGTGIYGPNKKPINLYWKDKDSNKHFYESNGMKPRPTVGPTMEKNKYKIRDDVIRLWED